MKTIYENNVFVTIDCNDTTCDKCSYRTKDASNWERCSLFNLIILNEERLELCKEAECNFTNFKMIDYYGTPLQIVINGEHCGMLSPEGSCQFLVYGCQSPMTCKLFGVVNGFYAPQRHQACIEKAL